MDQELRDRMIRLENKVKVLSNETSHLHSWLEILDYKVSWNMKLLIGLWIPLILILIKLIIT